MSDVKRDRPTGETSGSDQRPARRVAAPVLTFDLASEIASLKQEASWARGDRNARTLVEDAGFRLVLTVLKTGARMREHQAPGWVSLQGLDGHLRLQAREHLTELTAGRVVVLEPDLPHSVEAVEEGAFLLSIASSTLTGPADRR
jgi:quercetin dioxygenase-like cupin family protein